MRGFLASLLLSPALAFAREPAAGPLAPALEAGRSILAPWRAAQEAGPLGWAEFPKPDEATLARLARRIPGLHIRNVRTAPLAAVDSVMGKAADSGQTYLDVLTAPFLRSGHNEVFFLPMEVLDRLDGRYVSGTLPVSGVARDGKPFHMEAVVAGAGKVDILYDRTDEFGLQDGENEIKVGNAGHVACGIQGPGSVRVQGLKGCGCVGPFCGCADLQGMTKISPTRMRVDTSRGPQEAPVNPIRRR